MHPWLHLFGILLVNDYLLFFGFVYLIVESIDLAHTVSYKGMGILAVESADPLRQCLAPLTVLPQGSIFGW